MSNVVSVPMCFHLVCCEISFHFGICAAVENGFQVNLRYVFPITEITGLSPSSKLKSDYMNSSQSI